MRVLVLFDLPVETLADRRAYTQFRKFLIRNGFIMMQESVYSKIVQNVPAAQAVMGHVRIEAPKHGLIQMMMITEKQYANMELVTGHVQEEVVDSDERLVIV
ncbi:CRISPR-associated endonuclease Cas2 [Dialister pneumosintes]|jgi:CRISPR-associated endoribonuclease Cas2|uniref:CRISPR-associated endoribonuclease Cas2 n=1 Tax=Dialister pneumosintes TaxID=39950 RepID=A0A1B3WEP1_9FIRM|nr:CRISPR-associated endonuclease Cas2 [Dialister pneumosintes]AOH39421.1 CRISPR-associated endonuclease Cas2 [Dialister pneumosintes]RID94679.1 CRISPR-associated endonuclease Cas2 [Dialister pneumosintes]